MIARVWHGAVQHAKAEDYYAYLLRTGVPDYQRTPGNRGVFVLSRREDDATHFLLISLWESCEAIRAFAGDAIERARYYTEDAAYLLAMEHTVTHYDVLTQPTLSAGATTI
jgi:heme-degrading monooxygenase HmoA